MSAKGMAAIIGLVCLVACKDGHEQTDDSRADINHFVVGGQTEEGLAFINPEAEDGNFEIQWHVTSSDPYQVSLFLSSERTFSTENALEFFSTDCGSAVEACGAEASFNCRVSPEYQLQCLSGNHSLALVDATRFIEQSTGTFVIMRACNSLIDLCQFQSVPVAFEQPAEDASEASDENAAEVIPLRVAQGQSLDFSNASTIVQYDRVPAGESLPEQFDHAGGSNLMALDQAYRPFWPVNNIEPLMVNYLVESKTSDKLYLHVTTGSHFYEYERSLAHNIRLQDERAALDWTTPLIGPALDFDFPVTLEQLQAKQGADATFVHHDGLIVDSATGEFVCPATAYREAGEAGACIAAISYNDNGEERKVAAKTFLDQVQSLLSTSHFFCSLLVYDKATGRTDCVGGSREVSAMATIAGIEVPVDIRIPNITPEIQDISRYRDIRSDLRPLQMDDEGFLYFLSYNHDLGVSVIHRISKEGDATALIPTYRAYIYSFVVLADGTIAYSFVGGSDNEDRGLAFYRENRLIRIAGSADYYRNYQADDGAAIIFGGFAVQPDDDGGIRRIALIRDGRRIEQVFRADDALLGCIDQSIVPVVPFGYSALIEDSCHVDILINGHHVRKQTAGASDTLQVISLDSGLVKDFPDLLDNREGVYDIGYMQPQADHVFFAGSALIDGVKNDFLGEIDFTKPVADEEGFLRTVSIAVPDEAALQVMDILRPGVLSTAVDMPGVPVLMANSQEHSHVGVGFTSPMDKASVRHATRLEQAGVDRDYLDLWLGNTLYLFRESPGNVDQPEDAGDYEVIIEADLARGLAGMRLPSNVHLPFEQISRAAFHAVPERNGTVAKLRAPAFPNETQVLEPKADDLTFWSAYSADLFSDAFRYFRLTDFIYGEGIYRLEFDMKYSHAGHRWGIAVGSRQPESVVAQVLPGSHQVWGWHYFSQHNPLDPAMNTVLSGVQGLSIAGAEVESYPSISRRDVPGVIEADDEGAFPFHRFRVDIDQHILTLSVKSPASDTFTMLGQQPLSGFPVGETVYFWLAFEHVRETRLDNLAFSRLERTVNGHLDVVELIKSTGFERADAPFDGWEGLQEPATTSLAPVDSN